MNDLRMRKVKELPDCLNLFSCKEGINNAIYTDSTYLASLYGRPHKDVVGSIRRILLKIPELSSDIIKSRYVSRGKLYPCYDMTRKGLEIVKLHFDLCIRVSSKTREDIALSTIEQLQGIRIARQYTVNNYRLDGYCSDNNTAYEVDDDYHYETTGELNESCRKRQEEIQNLLSCSFVRIRI